MGKNYTLRYVKVSWRLITSHDGEVVRAPIPILLMLYLCCEAVSMIYRFFLEFQAYIRFRNIMRIWIIIFYFITIVCRVKWPNDGIPLDETEKTESSDPSRFGKIKKSIPCSTVVGANHRIKLSSPVPIKVAYLYERNIKFSRGT